jgi:DNA-binding MurR/RpiR family transcriptional regulator
MESILHKIRFMRPQMGPGEKKIADYILQNSQDIISTSISDFSEKCGCGDATVVRFARRLGFDGYQSLKIGIAGEMRSASSVSEKITKEDTCFDIFKKRINELSVSLANTETVLDAEMLEKTANAIMNSKRIIVFGLGNSASIAQDAAHKFLRLGFNAQACCDNHMQAIIATHLDRKSVAIGISHSGSSKDIVEALQLSKIGGATTVCITNYGNSPIVKACDYSLFTRAEETQHSILAMSSRIAQLTILDSIYTYIVVNSDKQAAQEIYKTELALQNKKF